MALVFCDLARIHRYSLFGKRSHAEDGSLLSYFLYGSGSSRLAYKQKAFRGRCRKSSALLCSSFGCSFRLYFCNINGQNIGGNAYQCGMLYAYMYYLFAEKKKKAKTAHTVPSLKYGVSFLRDTKKKTTEAPLVTRLLSFLFVILMKAIFSLKALRTIAFNYEIYALLLLVKRFTSDYFLFILST